MWPFRRRRGRPGTEPAPVLASVDDPAATPQPGGLPALRSERVLVALAVHAQQIDDRLARLELRLDDREHADRLIAVPTQDDLLEVQLHSARVSAELSRVAIELQARIDDLAVQMPAVVAEDRRLQRARTLAESILDLSDSWDTAPADLRDETGDWAATA